MTTVKINRFKEPMRLGEDVCRYDASNSVRRTTCALTACTRTRCLSVDVVLNVAVAS
jgi:hypothetical protein